MYDSFEVRLHIRKLFVTKSLQRNQTTYFEGEYAAISTNANDIFGTTADGRLTFPTMQSEAFASSFH